jgi:hypothetical protein
MKVKVWQAFSGPGSRALPAEIMRPLPFPGPVGPTGPGSPRRFAIPVGATGDRPMGPPHPAEAGLSLPAKGSPGRCFLRATFLTPGHGKGYLQREGGQGIQKPLAVFFPGREPSPGLFPAQNQGEQERKGKGSGAVLFPGGHLAFGSLGVGRKKNRRALTA